MHRFAATSLLLLCGCLDLNPNFVDPTVGTTSASDTTSGLTTGGSPTGGSATSADNSMTATEDLPTTTPVTTETSSTTAGMTTTSPGTTDGTTGAPEPVCGDAVVDPSEECDDGEVSEFGACPQCKKAACGDGLWWIDGEDCDDGNMIDDDACNNACKATACGDGILQADFGEVCDDGNIINSDGCVNCSLAACGDSEVWQGFEDCDDGNVLPNDGCEPDCHKSVKIVFVSSVAYPGSLGGLAGADDKCTKLAMAAMLPPGPYMAWLSDGVMGPEQRFLSKADVAYVKPNMQMVAANWKQLTSGNLLSPIDITEKQQAPDPVSNPCPAAVHSNTTPSGSAIDPANHCSNWTVAGGAGRWGAWNMSGKQWSDSCYDVYCGKTARLYCVQQ